MKDKRVTEWWERQPPMLARRECKKHAYNAWCEATDIYRLTQTPDALKLCEVTHEAMLVSKAQSETMDMLQHLEYNILNEEGLFD